MIEIRLQYSMPKLVISVLFSVLFFSLTTFAQEVESDFDNHLTRSCVEPKCGNSSNLHELVNPIVPEAAMLCGGGKFRLIFMDVQNDTGLGFDDPAFGTLRQNCACEVVTYIASVISIPSTIGAPNPTIDIVFEESIYDNNNSVLAFARPIFPAAYLTTPGYYGGYLYDFIATGVKPDPNSEDGAITVNFGHDFSYCVESISNTCSFDFYSVLLHEITHLFGFVSFVTNQPTDYDSTNSIKSLFALGSFSKHDEIYGYYLDANNVFQKIVDTALYSLNGGINTALPIDALTSKSLWLNNEPLISKHNHPICSKTEFTPGTSVSHFDNGLVSYDLRSMNVSPGFRANYVMGGYFMVNRTSRQFTEAEIKWFVEMGYDIDPLLFEFNLVTNYPPKLQGICGTLFAAPNFFEADNQIPFGNSNLHFVTTVCNPVSIHLNDLLAVDDNNDPIHVYQPAEANDGIYNFRGCGQIGNSSEQITLNTERNIITFTPRTNYFGRCQFAFHLADQFQRGGYVMVTIDVAKDACFENEPVDELVINGGFEYGSEVRNSPQNDDITLADQVDVYFINPYPTAMTDGVNFYTGSWNDAIIRTQEDDCIHFEYYYNRFPKVDYPLPSNDLGERYMFSAHTPSSSEAYNLTLASPIEQCDELIISCDVFNGTPEYGDLELEIYFHNNFTQPYLQPNSINFTLSNNISAEQNWQHVEIPISYNSLVSSNFVQFKAFGLNGTNEAIRVLVDNVSIRPNYNVPQALELSILNQNSSICSGSNNGWAMVNAIGGACPYTFQWSNDGTTDSDDTATATELGVGTYTCVVTDSNGMTSSISVTISPFDLPAIQFAEVQNSNSSTCLPVGNGSVTTIVSGGASPYSYLWSNNATTPNLTELSAGVYSLTVTDANGCFSSLSVEINSNETVDSLIHYYNDCKLLPDATVNFYNNTSLLGVAFNWDLGNGQTSNIQNPSTIYNAPGTYNVVLTITSTNCPPLIIETQITIFPFTYSNEVLITADSQTNVWNNNTQTFSHNIIFGNGSPVNITVHDAVFFLGRGVEIIVNENASVTFDRCTFTSCSSWLGFNVRSNGLTAATSGILRIDVSNIQNENNYSVIEHAEIGIEVKDERNDANVTDLDVLQGGRIFCGRTRFVNCRQAFNAKNASYKSSYFKLCQFSVNDDIIQHFPDVNQLPGYNQMATQCNHNRSSGYNYYGCSWMNSMSEDIENWTNRGTAIYSSGANLTVTHFVSNTNQNPIQGTTQGFNVGLMQLSKTGRVTLSYHNFLQNHIGAYFVGGLSHRVFKNKFVIGRETNVLALDEDEEYGTFPGNSSNLGVNMTTSYEGLVVRNTDLMEIAENTFEGVWEADELDNDGDNHDGVNTNYPRVGIRIRSTNTEDMVVRKNTLSKLNYANLANADNAGGSGTSGLRYICNVNSNNLQDFTNTDFVGTIGSATIGMIQQEPANTNSSQNNAIWPTGNVLSDDLNLNQDTYIHFRNEGVAVEYWYLDQGGSGNQTPTDALGLTYQAINVSHSCPAKYTLPIAVPNTPGVINGLVSSGLISKADADQYLYVYLLLLDGGNTTALQQYVESTWGNQLWATRSQLLSISPYVTSTVMTSVLDNTQVYPHSIAFELLMANPDLLNDPKLINYLSTKSDPMPQIFIDLLLPNNSVETSRTIMEKTLATKRIAQIAKVSEALWAMMDYSEDDTFTEFNYEVVIGQIGTLNSEMSTVEMLLDRGLLNEALDRAEAIPEVVKFGKGEEEEYAVFMDWINFRMQILNSNRDWSTLSTSDIAALNGFLTQFDTYAGSQAMEVFNAYKNFDYFIPPAYGQDGVQRQLTLGATDIKEQFIDVYPNPADCVVNLKFMETLSTQELCTLLIIDASGREVFKQQVNTGFSQQTICTEHWAEGLYVFKLAVPNSKLEFNGKFEVVH